MSVVISVMMMMIFLVHRASFYTKVVTDYDLYGTKVAMNDIFSVHADNFILTWFLPLLQSTAPFPCMLTYATTSCDFVYSVVVPISNSTSFVYNCIDLQRNNVIGFVVSNNTCNFHVSNEQIISNYSTQDNFVIAFDGSGTGVYGFADDFVLFYELQPPFRMVVWPNTLNISPRAIDIGANIEYGVLVGYCQSTPSVAIECAFVIILNTSLSCPISKSIILIGNVTVFPWSDPRSTHLVTQSRLYSAQGVLSVSIAWRTRRILFGIQSLNIVLLYALDDLAQPISTRQNGIGLSGFGKSVAWLDDQGEKAVILANSYSYSTYQWISSSVHIYDIGSDGFSDSTQPILIYPNSQQTLFVLQNPLFIRLLCSLSGNLIILDNLGNGPIILSAPAGTYADTNRSSLKSASVPCMRGTYRNYAGIELCRPCPNGTFSSDCRNCTSNDSFCPYGSIEELSYVSFESIEQDQEYPESPENTVFDDLLMQNMFSLNTGSAHCLLVSPIIWVLVVIALGVIVAIVMTLSEVCCPHRHMMRNRLKTIFKKLDLIGEGELWIGGLVSAGVLVLAFLAYAFSNAYFRQYPIENVSGDSSFACDVTIRNAKFSTTMQLIPNSKRSTRQNQPMFDLLNSQQFYLKIDLVQTAFTCQDNLIVNHIIDYTFLQLPITKCETSYNGSILSLTIALPTHDISVQLILPGLRTVGAIRLGLAGPSAVKENGRFTLLELNFASTFLPSQLNEVLAPSTLFTIQLTPIINQTAPLNLDGLPTFSAIWSSSFDVKTDEQFTSETKYTFFQRMQSNVTVTIGETVFYVSNIQEPIARQTEIIFRNLLFTIVILEVFGLIFLVIKLLIIPLLTMIIDHLRQYSLKNKNSVCVSDTLGMVVVSKPESPTISQQSDIVEKSHRRWSTIPIITMPFDHK